MMHGQKNTTKPCHVSQYTG